MFYAHWALAFEVAPRLQYLLCRMRNTAACQRYDSYLLSISRPPIAQIAPFPVFSVTSFCDLAFLELWLRANAGERTQTSQSLDRDRRCHAGHVHGDPRHHGGECLHTPHCGKHGRDGGGRHLGCHLVPGVERHHPADVGLAGQSLRASPRPDDLRLRASPSLPCCAAWPQAWSGSSSSACCKA